MRFELNGEARELPAPLSVGSLLESLKLPGRRVAVAVNQRLVPRSRFAQVEVREGDRVEVIEAVGGG